MELKQFAVLTGALFLFGCSTAQGPSAVNKLQIQVAQLENKIEVRDAEIENLKYELDNLSSQINANAYASSQPRSTEQTGSSVSATGSVSSAQEGDTRIIRVSASAQDIQTALKNAGYYTGPVDGKIGAKSKDAISAFQKDHGLSADGVIGQRTWAELKSYLN